MGKSCLVFKRTQTGCAPCCLGDITEVALEADRLVVNVSEGMLAEILKDGRREIESALRWQGLDLKLEVNLMEAKDLPQQEDINKLKKMLGKKLTIIGG